MGRLDGKVAIVTGAARGQGEAEARLFASEGAKVVLGDVLDDQGEAVAADIGSAARYVHLDVSQEADWAAAVKVAESLGAYRALVNNAAIIRPAAIEDTSLDDYLSVIHVNQVGCFLGMKHALAPMRTHGGGAIVNISSIDGMGSKNGLISYSASKFAVRGMTKTAAIEWGRFNIRVNSIHPGGVNTLMGNPIGDPQLEKLPYQFQAIQRIGYPPEIAAAALFLLSDEASYITGTELVVDGGWLAGRLEPGLPGGGFESHYGYNA
ncbi:MAG TPA: glucose 1-dehydrogenase [Acidimicrobiales bacterium]|jgi:3alpha(or 20beta)-hydroxysteroid dehydrogenase|nr:glucose 1-dehydrogenase [Acidimicrobiales bacterium]